MINQPQAPESPRTELWRTEDRLTRRMDAIEIKSEARHSENVKRLDSIERTLNQGLGTVSAVKFIWQAIIAMMGAIVGYIVHQLTNR